MNSNVRYTLILISLALLTGCLRDGPLHLNSSAKETAQLLNKLTPKLMEKHRVPGLSVAILQNGQTSIIETFGYRNLETKQKITNDTVFQAASLGKPIFAYIVTSLAEKDQFDLSKPLFDYLGELAIENNSESKTITARMILSHSSGLPNFGEGEITLHSKPGTAFRYSGHGYQYLQKAVEKAAQKSLSKLADEIVFQPLKMQRSSYVWRDKYRDDFAKSYDNEQKPIPLGKYPAQGFAAWSLFTTIGDYAKFVSHIINSSQSKDSIAKKLIREHSHINSDLAWGLGWGIQKTEPNHSIWHWGSKSGFKHYVVAYPKEGIAIIIMANGSNAFRMIDDIMANAIGGSYPSYDWF